MGFRATTNQVDTFCTMRLRRIRACSRKKKLLLSPKFTILSLLALAIGCAEPLASPDVQEDLELMLFKGDAMNPAPHILSKDAFVFSRWDADEPEGHFPEHMVFQMTDVNDPGLEDEMTAPYFIPHDDYASGDSENIGFPYRNDSRTRINGLGEDGISFINTGRERELGAVVVALNTQGLNTVSVQWTGGTLRANSRVYHLRLQYRVGLTGPFRDVVQNGSVVEYVRNAQAPHEQEFDPITLPEQVANAAYLQLRWRYYHTGDIISESSGARDMLRLDDIIITGE